LNPEVEVEVEAEPVPDAPPEPVEAPGGVVAVGPVGAAPCGVADGGVVTVGPVGATTVCARADANEPTAIKVTNGTNRFMMKDRSNFE
jgi:hypothetical protein